MVEPCHPRSYQDLRVQLQRQDGAEILQRFPLGEIARHMCRHRSFVFLNGRFVTAPCYVSLVLRSFSLKSIYCCSHCLVDFWKVAVRADGSTLLGYYSEIPALSQRVNGVSYRIGHLYLLLTALDRGVTGPHRPHGCHGVSLVGDCHTGVRYSNIAWSGIAASNCTS